MQCLPNCMTLYIQARSIQTIEDRTTSIRAFYNAPHIQDVLAVDLCLFSSNMSSFMVEKENR